MAMNVSLKNKTFMTTLLLGEASSAFQGLPNWVHALFITYFGPAGEANTDV